MEMLCWIKQSKGTKSKETCYFIWGVQIKLSDNVYLWTDLNEARERARWGRASDVWMYLASWRNCKKARFLVLNEQGTERAVGDIAEDPVE